MGIEYEWDVNPLRDLLFQVMLSGADLTENSMQLELQRVIKELLLVFGVEEKDVYYLDYKIKKVKDEHYKVLPSNIVTAMWFSGLIPEDCDLIIKNNNVIFDGVEYKFNKKTKKLTWKEKR